MIVTEPTIYPMVTDDNSPPPEKCNPPLNDALLYLMCYDGDEPIGMWLFVQDNSVAMEAHTYLLPGHGMKRGRQAAKEVLEFLWANTPVQRIWTKVPAFNVAARKFAKAAGFQQFGVSPRAFLKYGELWDVSFMGISRPEGL